MLRVPDPGYSLFNRAGSALRVLFISILAAVIGTIVGGACVGAAVIALIQPNHDSHTTARTTVATAEPAKAASPAASHEAQANPSADVPKSSTPASPPAPPALARPAPAMQAHASSPTSAHVAVSPNGIPSSSRYAKRRLVATSRAREPLADDNGDQATAADGRPQWNGYDYQRSRQISAARRPMIIIPEQKSAMEQPPPPYYAEQSGRGNGFFGLFNFFGNDNWHND